MATVSSDQRLKVFDLSDEGDWVLSESIRAHEASITRVGHPFLVIERRLWARLLLHIAKIRLSPFRPWRHAMVVLTRSFAPSTLGSDYNNAYGSVIGYLGTS